MARRKSSGRGINARVEGPVAGGAFETAPYRNMDVVGRRKISLMGVGGGRGKGKSMHHHAHKLIDVVHGLMHGHGGGGRHSGATGGGRKRRATHHKGRHHMAHHKGAAHHRGHHHKGHHRGHKGY